MANLNDFLSLAKTKVGCGYVLGAQGQIMTQALWDSVYKYNYETAKRSEFYSLAKQWFGKQCFDCSGLIVWTLQQLGLLTRSQDYIAHNIYHKLCKAVNKPELVAGDLCFHQESNGQITHVGIYIGNNQVLHARGTAYGVVITSLFSTFNVFGKLNLLKQEWIGWKDVLQKVAVPPEDWVKSATAIINAANAEGSMGSLEIFKFMGSFIEKIYNNRGNEPINDWKEIVYKMTSSPDAWDAGINAALASANAGAFVQLKFLPELIIKIYNSKV
jgi:Cell wall-associated hydrolases (invasion-associated proteins)